MCQKTTWSLCYTILYYIISCYTSSYSTILWLMPGVVWPQALQMLEEAVRREVKADVFTYSAAITACGSLVAFRNASAQTAGSIQKVEPSILESNTPMVRVIEPKVGSTVGIRPGAWVSGYCSTSNMFRV